MKNYTISIFFLLIIIFSGCLNYEQKTKLYPDGSGIMQINYWMTLKEKTDLEIIEKIGIFNPDSITKEFSSEYFDLNEVEVYSDSSDSTIHAVINISFPNIDSLNKSKIFSSSQFKLSDEIGDLKRFTQFIAPYTTGFGFNEEKFRVTYSYTISGDIIYHNAIRRNDQTLIWDYTLDEIGSGKKIEVVFKPFKLKETPYWVYILSGFVLLIVFVYLVSKRK